MNRQEIPMHYFIRIGGTDRYTGLILGNLHQVVMCMKLHPEFPWDFATVYDENSFLFVANRGANNFRKIRPLDYSRIEIWFDSQDWEPVEQTKIETAVKLVAFDSARLKEQPND